MTKINRGLLPGLFFFLKKLIIGNTKNWINGKEISMEDHTHSASDITTGNLSTSRLPVVTVNKGGTGRSMLTSGYFLRGNGTNSVTLSSVTTVQEDLGINDLKTSVSEGKALVAEAVTDKGVQTASDATFQEIADNILNIPTGMSVIDTDTLCAYMETFPDGKRNAYVTSGFYEGSSAVVPGDSNFVIAVPLYTVCMPSDVTTNARYAFNWDMITTMENEAITVESANGAVDMSRNTVYIGKIAAIMWKIDNIWFHFVAQLDDENYSSKWGKCPNTNSVSGIGANAGVGYRVEGSAIRFTFKGMNPSSTAYNGTTYGVRSDLAWAAYK